MQCKRHSLQGFLSSLEDTVDPSQGLGRGGLAGQHCSHGVCVKSQSEDAVAALLVFKRKEHTVLYHNTQHYE